ncbi:MAG TPA: plastocyanin/azurin family copper-binding protein [Candidatus Nitrosotalea sp.]|nr:plastocyanin/azurin family copper-binding protein [Candidatus Nitrosotalea sp.]
MKSFRSWMLFLIPLTCITFSASFAEVQVTIPLGASNPNTPFSLSPSDLDIQVNDTVTWKNNDAAVHTVTTGKPGLGFDGRVDSGVIAQGGTFSYTFDKSGVYEYYCLFHPWMTGFVSVGASTSIPPTGISVSTDKSVYLNGDTIQISGQVSKFIQNKQVTVWITDSKGTGISASHTETRTGSNFSIDTVASGKLWVPGNNYTVYAQYGAGSSVATAVIQYEPQVPVEQNNMSNTNTVSLTSTSYMTSYKKLNPDSNNYLTVQTEHGVYTPNDQIKLYGSIWSGLINAGSGAYLATVPVSNISGNAVTELVLVQIKDEHGNVVYTKETQVDGNGNYVVPVNLSNNTNGRYSVNSLLETKTGLLGTLDATAAAKLDSSASFLVATPSEFSVPTKDASFTVDISSNSTVSNFAFDSKNKMISFNVQGVTGTHGISDVVVPKSLLGGTIQVSIDGIVEPYNSDGVVVVSDTPSATSFEINYHHSMHTIQLVGTSAADVTEPVDTQTVPEFSSVTPIVLVVSILSTLLLSSKLRLWK